MVAFLPLFLAFIVLSLASAANLFVIQAGVRNPKAQLLSNGFTFCPDSFSNSGISVRCQGSDLSKPVSLYVNNAKVRIENFSPYTIAGDTAGSSAPWVKGFPAPGISFSISCTSSTSRTVSVTGKFQCSTRSPVNPQPQPQPQPQPEPQPQPQPQIPNPPASTGPITGNFQLINVNGGKPTVRHECGAVYARGKVYLMGGRRRQAMYSFDPTTSRWTNLGFPSDEVSMPNNEIHHFQAVAIGDNIYVPGAWYGPYPREKTHSSMFIYNIPSKKWSTGPNPPGNRRRGGGAVVVYNGKIYMGAGSSGGHGPSTTLLRYFDEYNPKTNSWRKLPDVPNMRDHVHGAVVGNQFCIGGGRDGSAKRFLEHSVLPIDCFNFNTGKWSVKKSLPFSQGRSGVGVTSCKQKLLIAGGESPGKATNRVEVFDPISNSFDPPKFMKAKRHGLGAVTDGANKVYVAAGAGNFGGGPELNSIEVLNC